MHSSLTAPTTSSATHVLTLTSEVSLTDSKEVSITSSRELSESQETLTISASNSVQVAWATWSNDTIMLDDIFNPLPAATNPVVAERLLLQLSLHGDRLDPSVVGGSAALSNPGHHAFEAQQATGTSLASSSNIVASRCILFNATEPAVLQYLRSGNVTIRVINTSTVSLNFKQLSARNSSALYLLVERTVTATAMIQADCMKHRFDVPPVNFTVLGRRRRGLPPSTLPTAVLDTANTATEATEIVAAASGGGLVASQMARSNLVLTLAECTPQFDTKLGRMQNPSQLTIGPSKYGQFVASAIINPIIMFSLAGIHALIGVVYAKVNRLPIVEGGFTFVRFPSISVLPLMYLAEPTCGGAVVTIIYAEEMHYRVLAGIFLTITLGLVVALFVYLKKTWAAEMIPGQNPLRLDRQKRTAIEDDDDINAKESIWKLRNRKFTYTLGYFIDGGVRWKNAPGAQGYCRRNRIMFMDYTGRWYWFVTVELGMAALIGILDGIKLGAGQCKGIIIALLILLAIFFVAVVGLRPYNAPFLLLFSILVTGLQLWGAIAMTVAMYGDDESWQSTAENMSIVGVYLVIFRAFFDIAPKAKQLITAIIRSICKPKRKANDHQDLTERLLEVVHDQGVDGIDVGDHQAAAERELEFMARNSDCDLLPEWEEEEEDATAWPEYEMAEDAVAATASGRSKPIGRLGVTPWLEGAHNADDDDEYDEEGQLIRREATLSRLRRGLSAVSAEEVANDRLTQQIRRRKQIAEQTTALDEESKKAAERQRSELDALLDDLESLPAKKPDSDETDVGREVLNERAKAAKATFASWGRAVNPNPGSGLVESATVKQRPTAAADATAASVPNVSMASVSGLDADLENLLDALEAEETNVVDEVDEEEDVCGEEEEEIDEQHENDEVASDSSFPGPPKEPQTSSVGIEENDLDVPYPPDSGADIDTLETHVEADEDEFGIPIPPPPSPPPPPPPRAQSKAPPSTTKAPAPPQPRRPTEVVDEPHFYEEDEDSLPLPPPTKGSSTDRSSDHQRSSSDDDTALAML